jgi:xanthine dehydrogenase large subunit
VIEEVMNHAAERLGLEPSVVKRRNFYGEAPRNLTPYYQRVIADRSERIYDELTVSANYAERREAINEWNRTHPWVKRGIAYQAVKFGISFTASHLNQAGALVLIYADGSVQLNHGGTEMGQGLHSKMLAICAHELGVTLEHIRMMNTATDKVPNTSATAASSGSDLNGQAVAVACRILASRLRPVAAALFKFADPEGAASAIQFIAGEVSHPERSETLSFEEVVESAYMSQISLSTTGFYRTPDISYHRAEGRGKPFHYFSYGGAVIEVEVNGLTGEHRVTHIDVLHDAGKSLLPSIDRGQVEGGLIQGLGWLTREEMRFSDQGYLLTHSPDTYKIPALGDAPKHFNVDLLSAADQPEVIHGSKAVGEPPFLLAIGVLGALRHAIGAYHAQGVVEALPIPCTPEAVLSSIAVAQGRISADIALERARG